VPPTAGAPLLSARATTKAFGGTLALDAADLDLHGGEIHALVGENGAGKSTLARILSGVHSPDGGTIELEGRPVAFDSPAAAQRLGITMIHQEPSLFPDLTVGENILIGRQPLGRMRWIDRSAMNTRARRLLATLGVGLDPRRPVRGLSVAELQMVEMAGALSRDSRVLLVDEPTASLTPAEVEQLFRILRGLRERGAAIVFVGHRLEEVFAIADRITVLRDGRVVLSRPAGELTTEAVIHAMVGRELEELYARTPASSGPVLLSVEGLCRAGVFEDISFQIREGEIVSLAGLVGAGRSEIAQAIFGVDRLDTGTIRLHGRTLKIREPLDAIRAGIAYLPEDRQAQGLAVDKTIVSNVTLAILNDVSRLGFLQQRREREIAAGWAQRLDLRARNLSAAVEELSGGNQQKVVVARWLAARPRLLILDEPTRGIDIGAKRAIHRLMDELVHEGVGILMISSDLPEVLAMSDRIVVVREGRIAATFEAAAVGAAEVMAAAIRAPVAAAAEARR
jgi:rhamnose transport system ATP-binding protein